MIYLKNQSGFSLVETLVAITILLLVVIGPMTIVTNSTKGTNFSGEQVTASFLAQEGLELAQKARDDLVLPDFVSGSEDDSAWQDFVGTSGVFAACIDDGAGIRESCGLQLITSGVAPVTAIDCSGSNRRRCRLYYDNDRSQRDRYTHTVSGNETTEYFRNITFEPDVTGLQEVKVTSRVTWRNENQRREQEVELVTYLYNVYGR